MCIRLQRDAEALAYRMYRVCTAGLKYLPRGGLSAFEYMSEHSLILRQGGAIIHSIDEEVRDVLEGV